MLQQQPPLLQREAPAQAPGAAAVPAGVGWQSSSDPLPATATYPSVLSTKFSCLAAPPEPLAGRANW